MARCRRGPLCAAVALAAAAGAEAGPAVRPDAEPGSAGYHWPRARGHIGAYSWTNHTLPWDLHASFAWKWSHPDGQYASLTVGVVIDGEENLYLSVQDGIRKFTPGGDVVWEHRFFPPGFNYNSPSLMDGLLFGSLTDGHVFALNMTSGQEVWKRRHATSESPDTGYVEAYGGRVVASLEKADYIGGDRHIVCLDAGSGELLWQVTAEPRVWNFMALFPGDETMLYMDNSGGVHRLHLENGTEIWHARSPYPVSMTDGGMVLGPDGTAYACSNVEGGGRGSRGQLRAYRLSDGEFIWGRELALPCTSWPVATSEAVVVPIAAFLGIPMVIRLERWMPEVLKGVVHRLSMYLGGQVNWLLPTWMGFPEVPVTPSEILAFEPKTGQFLWRYVAPPYDRMQPMGDEEGHFFRTYDPERSICLPAMWASPTTSGDGTTYVARSDGWLYAVRDANGDGIVAGEEEVATFWTGAGALHPGTAFSPNLMAMATCDSLFVFRRQ